MQVIYLDTLLAVNLFIDYVLLCIVKLFLHINSKHRRLIFGASVGAILSLCVFIPIHSVLLSAFMKILTACVVILTAFGKGTFRKTTIRIITFIGLSMVLSTAVVIFNNLLKSTNVIVYKDIVYFNISPRILLISTGIIYLCLTIYSRIINSYRINSSSHKVTVAVENCKKLTFISALDTGCSLKEPFSGLPVILTEDSVLKDISINENKMRVIPYSTIAGSDIIMGFKPTYLAIDGKELRNGCYIGICSGKLNGEIKSIMGPELLEAI